MTFGTILLREVLEVDGCWPGYSSFLTRALMKVVIKTEVRAVILHLFRMLGLDLLLL